MSEETIQQSQGIDSGFALVKLLADEVRWKLIQALRLSDHQVSELVERLGLPQSLISYHLGLLRQAGIVRTHRSDADARVIYYWLDFNALQQAYQRVNSDLRLPERSTTLQVIPEATVLFVCNQNSARSQIAEGWLRTLSHGSIIVRSAGVQPETLHPLAVQAMAEVDIDIGYQYAKDFTALSDLHPDVLVTVCDMSRTSALTNLHAARSLHWSVADPVQPHVRGEDLLIRFREVRNELRQRVEGLLAVLPDLLGSSA